MPASPLRSWIAGYTGYREEVDAPVERREIPSSGAVLVLSFGDPLAVSEPTRTAPAIQAAGVGVVTSFAGGISDRSAVLTHAGRQHGIQVRLGHEGSHLPAPSAPAAGRGTAWGLHPTGAEVVEPGVEVKLRFLDALDW